MEVVQSSFNEVAFRGYKDESINSLVELFKANNCNSVDVSVDIKESLNDGGFICREVGRMQTVIFKGDFKDDFLKLIKEMYNIKDGVVKRENLSVNTPEKVIPSRDLDFFIVNL